MVINKREIEITVLDTVETHRVIEIYHPDIMGGPCPLVCVEEIDGQPSISWALADIPFNIDLTRLFAETLEKATEIARNWEQYWAIEKVGAT